MAESATIQQDVENVEDETIVDEISTEKEEEEIIDDEPTEFVSDRDQTMKELAAKRRRQNQGLPLEEEEEEEELPPAASEDDTSPEKKEVVLKVNGQEVIKTQEEVDAAGGIAAIQKSLSGDMKLAQAASERKALEQERAELERAKQELLTRRQEMENAAQQVREMAIDQERQGNLTADEAHAERKARATEIAEKLFLGDTENIQQAVEEILEASSRPAPRAAAPVTESLDENVIIQRVTTAIQRENDRKAAVTMFEKEHSDLNTPGRRNYVNNLTISISTRHPDWMPSQIVEEAVKQTREDLGIPKPEPEDNVSRMTQRRTEKKKSVDKLPQASQRRRSPQKTSKPKTKREIFEKIAAQRSSA